MGSILGAPSGHTLQPTEGSRCMDRASDPPRLTAGCLRHLQRNQTLCLWSDSRITSSAAPGFRCEHGYNVTNAAHKAMESYKMKAFPRQTCQALVPFWQIFRETIFFSSGAPTSESSYRNPHLPQELRVESHKGAGTLCLAFMWPPPQLT